MPEGFFQYGEENTDLGSSSYEDFLVADKPGLEHLRSKIDEVLAGADEVIFDNCISTDFNGIRVAKRRLDQTKKSELSDRLAWLGCYAVLLIVLSLTGLGVWKLAELFTRR